MLIHKYHVTVGELCGHRLNAWRHGELCKPEYEPWNGGGTVEERSGNSRGRVGEPYQDLKTLQDVQDKTKPSAQGKPERSKGTNHLQLKATVLAGEVYNCYPRKIAKDDALRAISKAIQKIATRGATELHPDFKGDYKLAADWLQSRVTLYRESPQGRRLDKDKIPYPASWMNAGQYDDDPQEWIHVGGNHITGKANGKATGTSSALDYQAELLRQADSGAQQ